MNIDQIEQNIKNLEIFEETFIYDFLLAYGVKKATVTLIGKGNYNISKEKNEIFLAKKIFFKSVIKKSDDIHIIIEELKKKLSTHKKKPQFIIVTDFKILLAIDTKNNDTLDIPINNLPKVFDFFLPLAGLQKEKKESENPADIKAAEKLGKLYDLLLQNNQSETEEDRHRLNIFLSRLLFCFFAEDTEIFSKNQFTNAIASHTNQDGSDLKQYLEKLFNILNKKERDGLPDYLTAFPYVNGGLFEKKLSVPELSKKSRDMILQSGGLNWAEINPDIFGSMIQAVVHHSKRGNLGIHYTSVENIMKVIKPLFLNDLIDEFNKAKNNKDKLKKLLERIYSLKIFDPACGSGNFLIIAFKELCKLEIEIFKKLYGEQTSFKSILGGNIQLHQFYGVEIDDFAHETAKLSLWLAEHQMNLKFKDVFGAVRATLPLSNGGNIVCGNATRLNWEEVCPRNQGDEIYILGNPPYLGGKLQNTQQKKDLSLLSVNIPKSKNLDYISCWFIKASDYITETICKFAFVSTNSICQGEQVAMLWPFILNKNLEIGFAYKSFKWSNNAKGNAGVTCIILGIRSQTTHPKFLFDQLIRKTVQNINPYLSIGNNLIIKKTTLIPGYMPQIFFGSMPRDGGYLSLSTTEKDELIRTNPSASKFTRGYIGSKEFIRDEKRFCIWIKDDLVNEALKVPFIRKRVDLVKQFRLASKASSTKAYSEKAHRFVQISYQEKPSLIIPKVLSEKRNYLPIGLLNKNVVISDLAFAVYNPPSYLFATISSRMHMTWVRTVAGRLKTDYRYSATLCYNTFPFPKLSESAKETLNKSTLNILSAREQFPEKTLSELYDPDKMPEILKTAHEENDYLIEQCYQKLPFRSDEERLSVLFKLYEKMINKENLKKDKNAKKK